MEKKELLKKCPFCGGNAEIIPPVLPEQKERPRWFVSCKDCGCNSGYAWSKSEAVAKWNRRADCNVNGSFIYDTAECYKHYMEFVQLPYLTKAIYDENKAIAQYTWNKQVTIQVTTGCSVKFQNDLWRIVKRIIDQMGYRPSYTEEYEIVERVFARMYPHRQGWIRAWYGEVDK